LRSLQLEYYSTRADREGGWMQLKLRDATRTIRIDSELDGFADLAGRCAREAALRGHALDAATAANLKVLVP
jgi:chloramphenicol 3-O-phosphotransferase